MTVFDFDLSGEIFEDQTTENNAAPLCNPTHPTDNVYPKKKKKNKAKRTDKHEI